MAIDVLRSAQLADGKTARRVLLIWQNPVTRQLIRVGELDELTDGEYTFRYLPGAYDSDFSPLLQFPDLDRIYVSSWLPAFFANRVMTRSRENYNEYRHWIGLDEEGSDEPIEVLIRTGGPRATDTFHVVDDLTREKGGTVVSRFLASGVRHIDGANDRLRRMSGGHTLMLRDEPTNSVNNRALLIDASDGAPVGYVPDWLVEDLHKLRQNAEDLRLIAERISPGAPAHLRLLCRIEATL